jgi:hypothetical protein
MATFENPKENENKPIQSSRIVDGSMTMPQPSSSIDPHHRHRFQSCRTSSSSGSPCELSLIHLLAYNRYNRGNRSTRSNIRSRRELQALGSGGIDPVEQHPVVPTNSSPLPSDRRMIRRKEKRQRKNDFLVRKLDEALMIGNSIPLMRMTDGSNDMKRRRSEQM